MDQTSIQTDPWEKYWQGDQEGSAFSDSGVQHPSILGFWGNTLREISQRFPQGKPLRFCDLACGNGALTELATLAITDKPLKVHCIDGSEAAISNVQSRFKNLQTLVANLDAVPLEDKQFDILASQFGTEYGGFDAFKEAARLVDSNGYLVMLCHADNSLITAANQNSLSAIKRLQSTNFIGKTKALFKAKFTALSGGDKSELIQLSAGYSDCLGAVEAIMEDLGKEIANGTIFRLYSDIANLYESLAKYDEEEVTSWLDSMSVEIDSFASRLITMNNSALNASAMESIVAMLNEQYDIEQQGLLLEDENTPPLGWVVIAKKRA